MTATRFDNMPTAELVELERQTREDRRALLELIRSRFVAESGLEIGKAYRIVSGQYRGRLMLVNYIVIGGGIPMIHTQEAVYPLAEGPLNKGNGWNRRHVKVRPDSLQALEISP